MITLACLTCRLALRTTGEFDEVDYLVGMKSDWYPDRYPCPRSGCSGLMTLTDTIASEELVNLEVHDMTPQEAFQCFHGMGLPEERDCNPEAIRALMEQDIVAQVSVVGMMGTKRSLIHYITMSSGHRLYLASSPAGAVVYRIATPRVPKESLDESA